MNAIHLFQLCCSFQYREIWNKNSLLSPQIRRVTTCIITDKYFQMICAIRHSMNLCILSSNGVVQTKCVADPCAHLFKVKPNRTPPITTLHMTIPLHEMANVNATHVAIFATALHSTTLPSSHQVHPELLTLRDQPPSLYEPLYCRIPSIWSWLAGPCQCPREDDFCITLLFVPSYGWC